MEFGDGGVLNLSPHLRLDRYQEYQSPYLWLQSQELEKTKSQQ